MSAPVTDFIPHRPPFLFVDALVAETADSLTARRTWRAEEDFYRGHYPGAPITPGVLLCEAVFQTGALYLSRRAQQAGDGAPAGVPLLAKISEVRFRQPIYPGDETLITVKKTEEVGGFTLMNGQVTKADGSRVLSVSFAVAWKAPAPAVAAKPSVVAAAEASPSATPPASPTTPA